MGWIGRGVGGWDGGSIPWLQILASYREVRFKLSRVKFGCYSLDDLIFASKVSIPNLSLLVSLEVA